MLNRKREVSRAVSLRQRAVTQLQGRRAGGRSYDGASAALSILHAMAASPATAAEALTLLHELQVHQVELELQADELRAANAQLEAALERQTQLYEAAPVGCFSIDRQGLLLQLNLSGATLLGGERYVLLGQSLLRFLEPASAALLQALLQRPPAAGETLHCALQLRPRGAAPRTLLASLRSDGAGFVIALMETDTAR